MSPTTDDPQDPRLSRGVDTEPGDQSKVYLVLSDAERAKGFVRPLREAYIHNQGEKPCGRVTSMSLAIAETYARDPDFYGATYCTHCRKHLPVSAFSWVSANAEDRGGTVGS